MRQISIQAAMYKRQFKCYRRILSFNNRIVGTNQIIAKSLIFLFTAIEWVGPNDGERHIKIKFDENRKKIHVSDRRGKPLRMIDLRSHGSKQIDKLHIWVSEDTGTVMSVRTEGEIDLVSHNNSNSHL